MTQKKTGRLLVVDDEIEILTPLCDLLAAWGYEVMRCISGKEALEAFKTQGFDVLLTDFAMPEMDGIELIKASMELDPLLVCIIITGHGTIETAVEAMKQGAFDYVLKPVKWKSLRPIISRAMEIRKLRESEKQYRSIVEDQTELICRWKPGEIITYVNEPYCGYFDKKPEELIGHSFMSRIPKEDREEVRHHFASITRGNPVSMHEHRVLCADGRLCWQQWTNRAIFDSHGNIIEYQSVGRDITRYKEAEELLRKSEERFSTIFHSSPLSIAITRLSDNKFIDVNKAWQKLTGFTREEAIGHTSIELNAWMNPGERERLIRKMREHGTVQGFEFQMREKSGNIHDLLIFAELIEIAGEQCMLTMASDITERKQAEEKMQESEEKYRLLFNAETDAIMVFDGGSRKFIDVNNIAMQLYGYSREEFMSMYLKDVSAEPGESEKTMQQILAGKLTKVPLRYHRKKDGTIFPIEISSGMFLLKGKKIVIGAVRDISERKQAEERIQKYYERLSDLASQIALIEEKERRRFANELHDFTGQNLALAKIKLAELKDLVSDMKVHKRVEELTQLIEETVASTRSLTFELSPPILYELGFEAAAAWLGEQILKKYNISVHFEDDQQPKPLSDEAKVLLYLSLREVIVNIAKHAKAGNATISIRRVGHDIHITVTDDGIGFDATDLDYQIMKAASFGIFSTRERLKRLGGRLEVESQLGKGTRVVMIAPLKE